MLTRCKACAAAHRVSAAASGRRYRWGEAIVASLQSPGPQNQQTRQFRIAELLNFPISIQRDGSTREEYIPFEGVDAATRSRSRSSRNPRRPRRRWTSPEGQESDGFVVRRFDNGYQHRPGFESSTITNEERSAFAKLFGSLRVSKKASPANMRGQEAAAKAENIRSAQRRRPEQGELDGGGLDSTQLLFLRSVDEDLREEEDDVEDHMYADSADRNEEALGEALDQELETRASFIQKYPKVLQGMALKASQEVARSRVLYGEGPEAASKPGSNEASKPGSKEASRPGSKEASKQDAGSEADAIDESESVVDRGLVDEGAAVGPSERTREEEQALIARARQDFDRIYGRLVAAQTDQALWEVLEEELFEKVRALDLDGDASAVSATGGSIAEAEAEAEADAAETGPVSEANEALVLSGMMGSRPASLRILAHVYPSVLVVAARLLARRSAGSLLPYAILPTIKAIGLSSHVLGASTALYNELLAFAWRTGHALGPVLALLDEMERTGLPWNGRTARLLAAILRWGRHARAAAEGKDAAVRGEGQAVYALETLPARRAQMAQLARWRDRIRAALEEQQLERARARRWSSEMERVESQPGPER